MIPIPYHKVEKKEDSIHINKQALIIQKKSLLDPIYEELSANKGKTKATGLYIPFTQLLFRWYKSTAEEEKSIWQRILPYDSILLSNSIKPSAVIPWAEKTYGLRWEERGLFQSPLREIDTQAIEQSLNLIHTEERVGWLSIMEETHSVLLALYAWAHESDSQYIMQEGFKEEIAQRARWGEDEDASKRQDRIQKHIEKIVQWIKLTKI